MIVALGLVVAACGESTESVDVTSSIEGRQFWSTSVIEDGEPRPLVDGTRIQLRFDNGNIGASAGCNSMGGSYAIASSNSGGILEVTDMAMTEMGCDAPRHEQDQFVADLLTASPTITLDGNDLVLSTTDVTLTLLDRIVADPDVAIIGTDWEITGFIDGSAASNFAIDVPGTVTFSDDSTMRGHDGCGVFSGSVEVSDGSTGGPVEGDGEIQFGPIEKTKTTGCANAAYATAVHRTFETGDASFTIEGQNMTMLNRDGVGITLRADEG